ncbi:hypothetical protein ABZX90_03805 [Streptomyces sp. NPDC002935]
MEALKDGGQEETAAVLKALGAQSRSQECLWGDAENAPAVPWRLDNYS